MPRRRRRTLGQSLRRSFTSVSVLFVVLAGLSVARADAPLLAPGEGSAGGHAAGPGGHPLWEAAYSQRYPGCVSMVLWPLDEVPVALVTRTPAGEVSRVTLDEVDRAPLAPLSRARAIGACRR